MAQHNSSEALVIPSGAQFEASQQGWNVSNKGDVRLSGTPALPFLRITSQEGNVSFVTDSAVTLERIEAAQGEVHLSGSITVHSILAQRVVFEKGNLSVRSLVADQEISIQGEQLQADIILSPQVTISDRTRGRATVIESRNELGATALKGGFRLEDYLELFPNGQAQVEQYPDIKQRLEGWKQGVNRLPPAPTPAPVARPTVPVTTTQLTTAATTPPKPTPAPTTPPRPTTPVVSARPTAPTNLAALGPAPRPMEPLQPVSLMSASTDEVVVLMQQDTDDQPEVLTQPIGLRDEGYERGLDDILMRGDESEAAVETADEGDELLYTRLSDRFHKVLSCYSDTDLPPQISRLEKLIEERQFDTLRKELVPLYHDLLRYHKQKKQHIANAVTASIQDIKRILSDEA